MPEGTSSQTLPNTAPDPCPSPDARQALRRALEWARRTGRYATVGELWARGEVDPAVLDELYVGGWAIVLRAPSPPYGFDRATLALTRNAPRVLGADEAELELPLVMRVREAIGERLREGGAGWWTVEELAVAVGESATRVAVALVLLMADELSPNAMQLNPFGGCPDEFQVNLALATADVDPDPEAVEILTLAQYRAVWVLLANSPAPESEPQEDRLPSLRVRVGAVLDEWYARESPPRFRNLAAMVNELHRIVNVVDGRPLAPDDPRYRQCSSVAVQTRNWLRAQGRTFEPADSAADKS